MIVVQTSTSIFPATNRAMTASSSSASIWPWPISTLACGQRCDDPIAHPLDRRDAVVQEENLALPFQFAINRVANDPFIVRRTRPFRPAND